MDEVPLLKYFRSGLLLLLQAWVRNGYIPARKADTEASPPFSLPPSQPAPQEKLEYPEECFTKSYVQDETDVSVRNFLLSMLHVIVGAMLCL